ncbi:AAA family ATPase [Streptomyces thermocarboxydus]|uniref:ATP-binding protein n=2 Tax=Streptomyces thermocarboxydus TaxID=59299 RepID=A0ABU3J5Q6_9ACTN|nr:ATP-binding protein [Streptomyces thermocarboxydus]
MAASDQAEALWMDEDNSLTEAVRSALQDSHRHAPSLAGRLERAAAARSRRRPMTVNNMAPVPLSDEDAPLVTLSEPRVALEELVLTPQTFTALAEILNEQRHVSRLAAHGLRPRSKLLLAGPSGTGKTRTAEALAYTLGIPLVKVRLSAVVSSYLGQTARHLERILSYAEGGRWVVSFDEIDMFAGERSDSDHGEMRRVSTVFLQQLEDYASDNLVIATTNHGSALDSAMWRRFDEVLSYRLPTQSQIASLLEIKLRKFTYKINREQTVRALSGMSHAEIEAVCLDVMRKSVLAGDKVISTDLFLESANSRKKRYKEAGKSQG